MDMNGLVARNHRGEISFPCRKETHSAALQAVVRAHEDCLACLALPWAKSLYVGLAKLETELSMYSPLYVCPAISVDHRLSGTMLIDECGFLFVDPKRYQEEYFDSTYVPYMPKIRSCLMHNVPHIEFRRRILSGYLLTLGEKEMGSNRYMVGKHTRTAIEGVFALLQQRPLLQVRVSLVDSKVSGYATFYRHMTEDHIVCSPDWDIKTDFASSDVVRRRFHDGFNQLAAQVGISEIHDWDAVDDALLRLEWDSAG